MCSLVTGFTLKKKKKTSANMTHTLQRSGNEAFMLVITIN